MYVGRIVAIGCTASGRAAAMYRVSSRSFPNRTGIVRENSAAIIPKPGHEQDISRNPYIAYNCLRLAAGMAIATNGSQTDPIAEKIAMGVPPRDALVTVLTALDFEKDKYDTPRIAAVVAPDKGLGFLGIVRRDAVLVQAFKLTAGNVYYVCTYEHDAPSPDYADSDFDASDADEACRYVLGRGVFTALERPVSAACALQAEAGTDYEIAVRDAKPKPAETPE